MEANDYGSMHHNNSIQNKWFYLLANGDSGINSNFDVYDIIGVGTDSAISVLLKMFENLNDSSSYANARDQSILAAAQQCGEFSQARVSAHESWRAVGLFQSPYGPAPFTQPADVDTDVDPWPAVLSFEVPAQFPENSWVVEVAEDFGFTTGVQSMNTTSTGQIGTTQVGVAEFNLESDRQYFWRVRPVSVPSGQDCWRPVRSFRTAEMVVTPLSPVIERTRGEPVHPWELEFGWTQHAKATSYTVEVSKTPGFDPPLTQSVETTNTKVVLDVLVDVMQYWRVRPEYVDPDGKEFLGAWSDAMFQTTMPAVILVKPAQSDQVYPWPVDFAWQPVTGADHYLFEIKLARGGWGDPDGEAQSIKLDATQTSYKLNLRGDEHLISYSWRVRVFGPEIELLSLQQEGLPGNGYFKVRGSGTMPDPLTRGPDLCVSLNQPVALEWPAIPQATSYHLRVFEADCPYGQNCDRDGQMASVDVAAQPSSPQSYDFVPQAVSNNNAIGFVMKVKSFGPDGIPGMESSSAWPPVMIQPTKPNALVPSGMAEFELDEPVTLSWNSEKSHWGGFVVNVYKGSNSNCQGAPQLSYVHMGASLGQNNSVLTNVQFDSGTHNHSWKVKPFVGGLNYQNQFHQSCALPRWSNCATFKVVENVPPLTAPTVPDGLFGAIGSVVALWSVVEGADHYKVEVRADSPNGAVLGNFDWGVPTLINYKNQLAQQWQVDLSVLNIWIANIPGAAPLNRYFYQVKACAGQTCGPPSNWSEWWETYPWPF